MNVELRDEAQNDLDEGAWFYERQNTGLGDYFLDGVDADIETLEKNFGIHETVFGFQRKLMTRFPFAIYYRIADKYVDVVAILDCRRNPEYLETRLHNS